MKLCNWLLLLHIPLRQHCQENVSIFHHVPLNSYYFHHLVFLDAVFTKHSTITSWWWYQFSPFPRLLLIPDLLAFGALSLVSMNVDSMCHVIDTPTSELQVSCRFIKWLTKKNVTQFSGTDWTREGSTRYIGNLTQESLSNRIRIFIFYYFLFPHIPNQLFSPVPLSF